MNEQVRLRQHELLTELDQDMKKAKGYIRENGVDAPGTYDVPKLDSDGS